MHTAVDLVTIGSLFIEMTPTTPGESLSTAHQYTLVAGGGAANVVFALARLGVHVRFITAVGDDDFGAFLIDELAAFGVDAGAVRRVPGQLTPVTFCSIDRQGGKRFRFYRFPDHCSPMQALSADDLAAVDSGTIFDFSEGSIRDAGLRALVFTAARRARHEGRTVLYAVNLRRSSWRLPEDEIAAIQREAMGLADIVVLNAEETAFVTGQQSDAGLRAVQRLGPRVVVMTCGGDGDILVRVGEERAAVPPFVVPVVYDVGAGDTFHAGLVAAALRNRGHMGIIEWVEAVRFAAATAAIRVSTSADPHDLPTADVVTAWMTQHAAA
jgi:sugar/nucleoside kinase (ribokinase family)